MYYSTLSSKCIQENVKKSALNYRSLVCFMSWYGFKLEWLHTALFCRQFHGQKFISNLLSGLKALVSMLTLHVCCRFNADERYIVNGKQRSTPESMANWWKLNSIACAVNSCFPTVLVDPMALYPNVVSCTCQSQPDTARQQTGHSLEKREP